MANIAIVHTETHDETKPAGSRARSLGDDDIREKDRATRERFAIDHVSLADETGEAGIGIHKKVTMRVASDPTTYDDVGYLYLKTVASVIELFYKDNDGNVTQISTHGKILGDNVQLTNNTYLKAKNAAGTGTVDLIKASASDKPVLPDAAEMASDAAPTTDVQISNKKYVDDAIAAAVAALPAAKAFGAQVAKSNNTTYQAASDGFVNATAAAGSRTDVLGFTDSSNPPTTQVQSDGDLPNNEGDKRRARSIHFEVKSGDYWKVTGADVVYWRPLS